MAKELDPDWNVKLLIIAPGGVRTNFAGPSLRLAPRHPAYNVPASSFSQLLQYITNPKSPSSWSDPGICTRVLFDCVVGQDERRMPRRLLMGAEAILLTREDIKSTLASIDAWEDQTMRCSQKEGVSLSK